MKHIIHNTPIRHSYSLNDVCSTIVNHTLDFKILLASGSSFNDRYLEHDKPWIYNIKMSIQLININIIISNNNIFKSCSLHLITFCCALWSPCQKYLYPTLEKIQHRFHPIFTISSLAIVLRYHSTTTNNLCVITLTHVLIRQQF